jgi:hypothetical protein
MSSEHAPTLSAAAGSAEDEDFVCYPGPDGVYRDPETPDIAEAPKVEAVTGCSVWINNEIKVLGAKQGQSGSLRH